MGKNLETLLWEAPDHGRVSVVGLQEVAGQFSGFLNDTPNHFQAPVVVKPRDRVRIVLESEMVSFVHAINFAFEPSVSGSCSCSGSGSGSTGDIGSGGTFTNTNPTLAAWDQIPEGTNLAGKTWQEILEMQMYPYQEPEFSTFTITTTSGVREVGNRVPANRTLSYTLTNPNNVQPNSLKLVDHNGATVVQGAALNTSPLTLTYPEWVSNVPGISKWTISGRNTRNQTFSMSIPTSWRLNYYYGTSTNEQLTAAQVKALQNKRLTPSAPKGSLSFPGGGYKYICWPKRFGNIASIKDASNNLPVSGGQFQGFLSLTSDYGITEDYYVFRTTNILGGSITMVLA